MLKIELEYLKDVIQNCNRYSNSVQLQLVPKPFEIDGCPVLEATYQCTRKKSVLNKLNNLGNHKHVILYNKYGILYALYGIKLGYSLYKHREKYDFLNPTDYDMPIHKWS